MIFELENLVVNNKDSRVFISRNYRFDSFPERFVTRANICVKNIKFPRGMYKPDVSSRKTLLLFK